jgi:hypothetical protein
LEARSRWRSRTPVRAGEEGVSDRGLRERRHADHGDRALDAEDRGDECAHRDAAGPAGAQQVDEQRGETEQSDTGAEDAQSEVACQEARARM